MGYKQINIKLPTDYSQDQVRAKIASELRIKNFSYQIDTKSLDARNKRNVHWQIRVGVTSPEIKNQETPKHERLEIPHHNKNKKAIVVGSGPAGFFAAYVLQKAGLQTTIIERGTAVHKRAQGIEEFERTGIFNETSNYSFGEGGAGTFSDGKLTSRSKHISVERKFILDEYIKAGAPEEIAYLAHPHVGTDNLKIVVKNLRIKFKQLGGEVLFETQVNGIQHKNGFIASIDTTAGQLEADYIVFATGHSAFETYRMLIRSGVPFRTKNFAIGSRIEHRQEVINEAQWGIKKLQGVKAAEYRLTSKGDGNQQVYTFCMCPGGMVVPAAPYKNSNIVNGMSYYQRNMPFANAASVAGIHPNELLNKEAEPLEVLDYIEQLEHSFYDFSNQYKAPFCSISDFIDQKLRTIKAESSYPLGIEAAPLWEMLPEKVVQAIRNGFNDFERKIRHFHSGNMLGLETKTSSPIQVIRDKSGLVEGFKNLFIIGEGSGYSGGIISSAADGVKCAIHILHN